jgi:hypothetical protein
MELTDPAATNALGFCKGSAAAFEGHPIGMAGEGPKTGEAALEKISFPDLFPREEEVDPDPLLDNWAMLF